MITSPSPLPIRVNPAPRISLIPSRSKLPAFTLIELLSVIAILGILLAILIPSIGKMRERTHTINCASNLRQIGVLVGIYIAENDGYVPYWITWTDGAGSWTWDNYAHTPTTGGELPRLAGYHPDGIMNAAQYDKPGSKNLFNCPSNTSRTRSKGYAANTMIMGNIGNPMNRIKLISLQQPGKMVLIADNAMSKENEANVRWFNRSNWRQNIGFNRHGGRANILFCDFSVRSAALEELSDTNIDPQEAP
jgi:prepilin-type processing-associated H-X9-DG protein/prepilin-type N-terminal cleavage/methylation domain-containing protein